MAEREEIIKITIDTTQLAREANEATAALKDFKDEQKRLTKTGEATSEELATLTKLTENQRAKTREATKDLKDAVAQQNAAKGSIKAQREEVKQLNKEWVNQSTATKEGAKRQEQLGKQLKSATDRLKEQESAVGNNSRNVGNYSESMKEAISQSGIFGSIQGELVGVQQKLAAIAKVVTLQTDAQTASIVGLSKAQKFAAIAANILRIALIATGIGALIVLLGAVVAWFTKTKDGVEAAERAFAAFSAAVSVVIDRLSGIIESFRSILRGDVKAGIEGLTSAFSGMGAEIASASRAAFELEGQMQKIVDRERDLSVARAQARKDIDALRLISEDQSRSSFDRIAAAEKALGIELDLQRQSVEIAQERVKVLEQQQALSENLGEDFDELAKAQVDLANIEAESIAKQIRLNTRIVSLRKEIATEDRRQSEERQKTLDDNLAANVKRMEFEEQAEIDAMNDLFAREDAITEKNKIELEKRTAEFFANEEKKEIERKAQAQRDIDLEIQVQQTKLAVAQLVAANVQGLVEGTSGLAKAAGISSAIVSTYSAATAALAPPPIGAGPLLGGALAATTIVAGLANVAKIASARDGGMFANNEFAKFFEVGGQLHSNGGTQYMGEDGNRFEVERNEVIAVVNRKSGSILKSLSNLNSSNGGVPFFQDGGIASRLATNPVDIQIQSEQQISNMLSSLPRPIVLVEDIRSGVSSQVTVESLAQS